MKIDSMDLLVEIVEDCVRATDCPDWNYTWVCSEDSDYKHFDYIKDLYHSYQNVLKLNNLKITEDSEDYWVIEKNK